MSGRAVAVQPAAPARLDAAKLLRDLDDAMRQAGVQRDDPIMPLFNAIAHIVRFTDERSTISDRVLQEATERIAAALGTARESAAAETERFRAELAAVEAQTADRIAGRIARSADQALTARVKLLHWRTFVGMVFLFGIGLAGSYLLGEWSGRNIGQAEAEASIHQTEATLQTAFHGGVRNAKTWWLLMESNDIATALNGCPPIETGSNRRACAVPLWIDPAPPAVPAASSR